MYMYIYTHMYTLYPESVVIYIRTHTMYAKSIVVRGHNTP